MSISSLLASSPDVDEIEKPESFSAIVGNRQENSGSDGTRDGTRIMTSNPTDVKSHFHRPFPGHFRQSSPNPLAPNEEGRLLENRESA
jgi:hypothetical protein